MTMRPLGEPRAHYWRVIAMAKATGLDLVRAFEAGELDSQTWADTVQRCRSCAWVGGCDRWVSEDHDGSAPPTPCLNRRRLALLRLEQELETAR
jgi:hypothetical protein